MAVGRSASGGMKLRSNTSPTFGVRRQLLGADEDIDRLAHAFVADVASWPIFEISGEVISSDSVASRRARSMSGLISGSRFCTASMAALGSAIGILDATVERLEEALHGVRVFLGKLARDNDGVGIQIHAVVAELDEANLFSGSMPISLALKRMVVM